MKPEQHAALRKPFDPKTIGKLPKGGVQLDFVGHAAVTDRLLAVDPSWTWEPLALDEHGLPAYDKAGGLWIRMTVCGVTRLGYGDGPDPKQRIGDAIRNAAMRFGVALDLWSRQELESIDPNGGDAAAQPRTADAYRAKQDHKQLVKEALHDDKKAARGVPADDPWAGIPVAQPGAETDVAWFAGWQEAVAQAPDVGALRALWTQMNDQHKSGGLTDADRTEAEALVDEVKSTLAGAA